MEYKIEKVSQKEAHETVRKQERKLEDQARKSNI